MIELPVNGNAAGISMKLHMISEMHRCKYSKRTGKSYPVWTKTDQIKNGEEK